MMRSLLPLGPLVLTTLALGGCAAPEDPDAGEGAEAMTTIGSAFRSRIQPGTFSAPATTAKGLGAFLWVRNVRTTQLASLDVDGTPRCGGEVDVPVAGGRGTVEDPSHHCTLTLEPDRGSVRVTLTTAGGAAETFQVAPVDLSKLRGKWTLEFTVGGLDAIEVKEVTEAHITVGRPSFGRFPAFPRASASGYLYENPDFPPYVLVHLRDGRHAIKHGGSLLANP